MISMGTCLQEHIEQKANSVCPPKDLCSTLNSHASVHTKAGEAEQLQHVPDLYDNYQISTFSDHE